DGSGGADRARGRVAARRSAQGERQRDRRVGHRQGLSQRRGGRAREELRGAQLHSGEASKRAAQLAGQSRGTTGGVPEPAAGARRLRQELTAAARRVGGTQLCALLRHWRHEAHAPPRTREHSEAAVGSCRRLQPEPDPAPGAGRGNAAGVEKPVWRVFFAGLFPAHAPGDSESALQKPKRNVPREILSGTAKPNMPLAVPKTSYLHHRLLAESAPRAAILQRRSLRSRYFFRCRSEYERSRLRYVRRISVGSSRRDQRVFTRLERGLW